MVKIQVKKDIDGVCRTGIALSEQYTQKEGLDQVYTSWVLHLPHPNPTWMVFLQELKIDLGVLLHHIRHIQVAYIPH